MSPRGQRWLVLAATVLCVGVAARLGVWQLDRAAQKQALQAALDARSGMPAVTAETLASTVVQASAQHYRRVRLLGRWVAERTVFLENRQMKGRPGFFVVTPLQLSGGQGAVLVQRGWAPRDIRDRSIVPVVPSPAAEVEVLGFIAPPPARLYEFSGEASGPIRQNLDLTGFSREAALPLRPLSVLQVDSAAAVGDGLLREWPQPALDLHKHFGYAFQWFALGALMTGLYVWFQLVRPRLHHRARHGT